MTTKPPCIVYALPPRKRRPKAQAAAPTGGHHRLGLLCEDCRHRTAADLAALVRDGRGDIPIVRLKWRCSRCGSRRVSAVVLGGQATG